MVVIYDLKHGSEEIGNFNSLLNNNNNKIAYVVHKPGCPACNAFIPNWNIFQKNMMKKNISNIIIARINVDVLNLVDLKDKNTIFGVPHISLQNKNKIIKYNGDRTPEDLEKWFLKSNMIGGNKRKTVKRKWSLKYKRNINCKKPKGFSQKQYCKRINKTKRTRRKK
tara:strand:- start:42 stop:542 length:501 start_codon:yes stop_codon:yes gene_type:complete